MELHPNLDHVKDQILLMDPLPCLDEIYSMMSRIEKWNKVLNTRAIEMANTSKYVVVANVDVAAVANFNKFDRINKSQLKCSYCNGIKYTRETCFKLVGYPEWWGDKEKMRARCKFPNTYSSHTNQSSFVDNDVNQERGGDFLEQAAMNRMVQEMYHKVMKGKEILESPMQQQGTDIGAFAGYRKHFVNLPDGSTKFIAYTEEIELNI